MGTIIDYAREQGARPFDEAGFGEVDSLILSELAYLDYSCCAVSQRAFDATIGELPRMRFDPGCPSNRVEPDRCARLFGELAAKPRFRDVGVGFYVNEIDTAEQKQFSAVTFRLAPGMYYAAFRGTDSTVVGWKEDLNMAFLADLPAQRAAAAYLARQIERLGGVWIAGGHSKGGNLAVYAAMSAPPEAQAHLALVYDHDGPGFLERVLARPGFEAIRSRTYKTVPESAVVGLLLAEHAPFTVVESDARAILQHDPFTWRVDGDAFVRAADVDWLSKTTNRTLTRWLDGMSEAERREFVDALYELIQATGARTLPELVENWRRGIPAVYAAIRDMDPSVRRMLLATVLRLARASGESVRALLDERIVQARDGAVEELADWIQRRLD